ncbi:ABC transporter ATP-binding protein [Marinithermofilum abyssi]|uniref:ABC transporter ATP-binding protein n=1 Tax=Marinithermofilum abyssi TaxID=1571185 RepID=A0A8J2YCW6_9BACL|nr:dipeptide ABC transporter ATP-binding protein [Marinithermofilum abyssi]GGE12658.1 ABC transporter ATP-binding protein [Marinithermofilum abyssi]
MPEKVLAKLENVKKYYPVRRGLLNRVAGQVKAVDGVSLVLHNRETLGVVGESGCGKSTLGRTLLRLEKPTEGRLYFNGTDISSLSARALQPFRNKMQMIFQDPFASLNPRQRIGDALEEPLVIHTQLNREERRERVMGLLEEVGLRRDHYDRLPHEFSGGQRQRIGIARALALNPSLIVCDEPVSALDVSVQAQVLKLLQSLQEKHGLTYFFISHDLGVVRHLCDRVLIMYLGQTMELAPVKELYKNPVHPYTEALLSAIPRPVPGRKRERIILSGDLPSPAKPPKGCPFHTRCPEAMTVCKEIRPEWKEVAPGHQVACHVR